MKQKSKSFDDELEPTDKALIDNKQSYSCSEIPQLSSIKEEGDTSLRNIGQSKTYRRKMFARCKTQEVTMSFSPASSLKSTKSSLASLSSGGVEQAGEQSCIITLSSPESTAPPILIFPDQSRAKEELRKQVSFENSLDQIDQRSLPQSQPQPQCQTQVNYRAGRASTSVLSEETGSVSMSSSVRGRARSVTSNTSTQASTSTAQVPHLKYITIIWSLGLLYTIIEPTTELCCLTQGNYTPLQHCTLQQCTLQHYRQYK